MTRLIASVHFRFLLECFHQAGKRKHRPDGYENYHDKQCEFWQKVWLRPVHIPFLQKARNAHTDWLCFFHIIRSSLSNISW